MGGLQEWKKKAVQVPGQKAGSGLEKTVRKQLAAAVGADYFDNRDPVRHITEDFQKTFDLMGSRKARERSGMLFETEMKQIVPGLSENRKDQEQPAGLQAGTPGGDWSQIAQQRGRESFLEQSSMDDMVEPTDEPGQQMFLSRFAQVAFNRGTLAGAVLRGTGKMMLFSCLKRTAGQSQPMNLRQRKLFEGSSQRRNVTGHTPDQVMFNRGEADGAVGLVVDVLRDARRVVDSMAELASGKNQLGKESGAQTLQKAYPFLNDEKEQALLAEYRGKLKNVQDPQSREILQHAIVKTEALMEKKQQMKQRFITTLRSISDSATAALDAFTQPGFSEELVNMLGQEAAEAPPPPPEDGDGKEPENEQERE